MKRLTVNLAPADLPKQGPAFDLPIAVGILWASGQVSPLSSSVFIGELSLDGSVRHVDGILAMVSVAKEEGFQRVFVPHSDAPEASLIGGLEVRGQEHVKRALEVAAAGGHNVLMSGPPGAGKTLLARALPTILPTMTIDEALDVTKIYSVRGLLPGGTPLIIQRPFRSPGVLFLDELPEFGHRVLEVMRQPMEDRVVTISRAKTTMTFPANFMLIGAMNPCPCGYFGDPVKECTCSPAIVTRYQKRLSGPLLDRIDIHVEVPRVEYEKLASESALETSEPIRRRVEEARERQRKRFEGTRLGCNAGMGPGEVREYCQLDDAGRSLLRSAMQQLQMSARAFHRILKLARTIADLAGEGEITTAHLAEAIQYRPRRQM